jgi:hypothetical protein
MNPISTVTGLIVISVCLPMAGAAEAVNWTPPTLGYLFDSDTKSIRPLSGIPGAASLESGLAVGSKLEKASISPNRKFAIAEIKDGEHLLLVSWSGTAATAEPLDGAPATAEQIAFSASGSTAALWTRDAHRIQLWKGLPDHPSLYKEIETAELTALAVSDDGDAVAAATEAGLVLAGAGRTLASGNFSGLAFLPGTHDLAAAERSLDQVLLISKVDSDPDTAQLASIQDGVAQPVALAFSADARKLIVANLRGRSVLSIDLESRAVLVTPCECQADGLYRAQGNSVFRLTNGSQDLIALFDGDSSEPRVLNIPAGAAR